MEIHRLTSGSPGVQSVIQEIDQLMTSLYAEAENVLLPLSELDLPHVYFVGIYINEVLAACGAVISKQDKVKYGEFKRIYVKPEYRGLGLSKSIITHFIDNASAQGHHMLRLETGDKQLAAITLYESFGFQHCAIFGDYSYDPEAIYMQLAIK